jgi:hypothetical protein
LRRWEGAVRAAAALPLLAALLSCGCGYSVVRGAGAGPALRVAAFKNPTAQPEVGGLFAAAAREQLHLRGRLLGEDALGPVLEGELLSLRTSSSVLSAGAVGALRVEADLRLRVVEGGAAKAEEVVTGGEEFLQGVDVLGTEANRRTALRRLADQLLRAGLERLEAGSLLQ